MAHHPHPLHLLSMFSMLATARCFVRPYLSARSVYSLHVRQASIQPIGAPLVAEATASHILPGLVTPEWLEARVEDPNIRIIDIRGEVAKDAVGSDTYQQTQYRGLRDEYVDGHIPNAVFVDWTTDIAGTDENGVPVQLLPRDELITSLEQHGISLKKRVVIYDSGTHLFATRLWWALRLVGHPDVAILDGGYKRWLAEGRPVSIDSACPLKIYEEWGDESDKGKGPEEGTAPAFRSARVDASFVLCRCVLPASSATSGLQLIDARSRSQFEGRVKRASRGGHIPGALSVPYKDLLSPEVELNGLSFRTFQKPAELQRTLAAAGVDVSRPSCVYCNGGVASTAVIFVLNQLFGLDTWNYDGSWNEWGEREDLPLEL